MDVTQSFFPMKELMFDPLFTNRLWRECRNETSEVQLNWLSFDDLGLRPEAYQI